MVDQLRPAHFLALVDEIGEDHDIGVFAQRGDPFDRAGDRRLAMHFGIEEAAQLAPDFLGREDLAAVLPAQRLGEIVAFHAEFDALRFGQPVAEGRDHVEQHFIAVGYDQWAGHLDSSLAAATSVSGVVSSASAARTRSGS